MTDLFIKCCIILRSLKDLEKKVNVGLNCRRFINEELEIMWKKVVKFFKAPLVFPTGTNTKPLLETFSMISA
jgi:hypothetical protein